MKRIGTPLRLRLQSTRYPHWGRYSGIGQFARHLDNGRFSVESHAASDGDDDLPIPSSLIRGSLRRRVQRNGMHWYKLSDLAAELKLFATCATRRADIVHFLDGEHGVQFLPRWLDRLPGTRPKLVASYHQPNEMLPDLVDRAVVSSLDRVVIVSPAQRPFFEAIMPSERVVTILHGIDIDFFQPDPTLGDDGIFRCVTVGHWLRDWATIGAVADALKEDESIQFHVVTGRETGLEHLPNVRFHRNVSDEELRSVYQRGSALFLPLVESTANNCLMEGMACGLPVISTRLPSVQAYMPAAAALLGEAGDVPAHLAAINRLRSDAELCDRLSVASRVRAEELSWDNIATQYAALYESLFAD